LLILQNGPAMREAQEQLSKRIVKLLGLTLGGRHEAPLAPAMPNRVEVSRKKGKTDANDPTETSRISALDDHKCYSFAIKCRAASGAGGSL
jgi:hypothetical protein